MRVRVCAGDGVSCRLAQKVTCEGGSARMPCVHCCHFYYATTRLYEALRETTRKRLTFRTSKIVRIGMKPWQELLEVCVKTANTSSYLFISRPTFIFDRF